MALPADEAQFAFNGAATSLKHEFTAFLPVKDEAYRIAGGQKPGDNYRRTLDAYLTACDDKFVQRSKWLMAVVDDGSRDEKTADIAEEFGIAVLHSDPEYRNRGRGIAYQVGFLTLSKHSNVIGAYDGDGSYSPEVLIQQYEAIINGADAVVAFRSNDKSQHEPGRAMAHKALRATREVLARTKINDTQAGAFALSALAARFLWDRDDIKPKWAANHQMWRTVKLADMTVAQAEARVVPKDGSTVGKTKRELVKAAVEQVADTAQVGLHTLLSGHREADKWQNLKKKPSNKMHHDASRAIY